MKPKVALVCDWLTNVGGAERVLLAIHEMYPDAPIYTSQYNERGIDWFKSADVRTGWMQILPSSLRRFFGPLRQHYFSHLDLSDYDLIISVTGAEAKSVRTTPKKPNKTQKTEHRATHICYCHVPTQYYWQMYDDYLKNPGFGLLNPLARFGLKLLVKPLRKRDYAAAKRPDAFVTISSYAAAQIKKYYGRESVVISPPVNVEKFRITGDDKKFSTGKKDFSTSNKTKTAKSQIEKQHKTAKSQKSFITTSRQVSWKRIDLCIKACLKTGDDLTIIGEGPEHENLERLAKDSKNIKFLPRMSQAGLKKHIAASDGYLFPSKEPFGIAPVEALAAGCPVIAYGEGGALDYVKPEKNGLFFEKQTTSSLVKAIEKFKTLNFPLKEVEKTALPFAESNFKKNLKAFIDEKTV